MDTPLFVSLLFDRVMDMTDVEFSDTYDDGDEVVWVTVEWLMKNIDSSCDFDDFDLAEIMRYKCKDTGMTHLINSIIDNGFDENGSIGFCDGQITEGHHRLCAAILLCLDKVPISAWGGRTHHGISAHWMEGGAGVLV